MRDGLRSIDVNAYLLSFAPSETVRRAARRARVAFQMAKEAASAGNRENARVFLNHALVALENAKELNRLS